MRRTSVIVGVAVVLLVAVPMSLGWGSGTGSDGGSSEGIESFPTETPSQTPAESDAGETTTPEPAPAFAFTIDRIEECGETCRDVTSTLANDGAPATDVTVYTRIYVGNGTDGDVVWEGNEPIGDLGAGESYTTTKRVDLSITDAYAIQQADGWITVQTTIESDEKTVTSTQQRNVL